MAPIEIKNFCIVGYVSDGVPPSHVCCMTLGSCLNTLSLVCEAVIIVPVFWNSFRSKASLPIVSTQ